MILVLPVSLANIPSSAHPKSGGSPLIDFNILTLLHSERPKLYTILAFLSAVGLSTKNENIVFILYLHSWCIYCKESPIVNH